MLKPSPQLNSSRLSDVSGRSILRSERHARKASATGHKDRIAATGIRAMVQLYPSSSSNPNHERQQDIQDEGHCSELRGTQQQPDDYDAAVVRPDPKGRCNV